MNSLACNEITGARGANTKTSNGNSYEAFHKDVEDDSTLDVINDVLHVTALAYKKAEGNVDAMRINIHDVL